MKRRNEISLSLLPNLLSFFLSSFFLPSFFFLLPFFLLKTTPSTTGTEYFRAFDASCRHYIDESDFVIGLSAMEPDAPNSFERLSFVYRMYADPISGNLIFSRFLHMVPQPKNTEREERKKKRRRKREERE